MDLLMEPILGEDRVMDTYAQTERTRVRRLPDRARYDAATVHAILDAGLVCTVSFVEDGRPMAIPTAYARVGDALVLHGSAKSRTLLAAGSGTELCVTVTHLDGLVLARSAFHHSVNYRSLVIFGRAEAVTDPARKLALLRAFTERLYPGRWSIARPPSEQELKATLVVRLPLREVVAKVRAGGPLDDADDMGLPVWAGVVPLRLVAGTAEPALDLAAECAAPDVAWPRAEA
jgi:nitroimidazol reductase NimA-like FMN-containing flavoprotein (pyridoxamine 5'-phosphate oxidase superfamily)